MTVVTHLGYGQYAEQVWRNGRWFTVRTFWKGAHYAVPPSRVCRICGEMTENLQCFTCGCRTTHVSARGAKR